MFKTIFNKLMITYLIIIIITLAGLGVLLSSLFKNYYFEKKQNQMVEEGKRINQLAQQYSMGMINIDRLNIELQTIDRYLEARIWFVDRFGYVWTESGPFGQETWEGQKLSSEEISKVFEGRIIRKSGNFGERFSTPVLTIGMPIVVNDRITGAMFMHSPIFEIRNTLAGVYRLIWISAFFSVIIAVILLYWITVRITNPLKEMNRVAKTIAGGNFEKRVSIKSMDEVGQLGNTFNHMAFSLENLENLRRSFIANVSHELRSPLTTVKGFIKGILDGTIPKQEHETYLNTVLEETDRLNRMVNDLLDLSTMEAGQLVLEKGSFDINELIRRVIIKYETKINERRIDIKVRMQERECFVLGDQDRIEQVISNLIDNAIKYNKEEGQIRVYVYTSAKKAVINIKDLGVGIEEDKLHLIWDRFYKVDQTRSVNTGAGLGLSIARKIIEEHEEDISVESKKDKGTQFRFTLPVA